MEKRSFSSIFLPTGVLLAEHSRPCLKTFMRWGGERLPWLLKVYRFTFQEVEGEGVEIIFVSSDRSPQDMANYMKVNVFKQLFESQWIINVVTIKESHGNWLAMPHGSEIGQELKKKFGVSGIPCLVVLKGADGTLITKEGRNAVQAKGPAAVKEWK